ncbi:MAG: hypothetical protein U5R49_03030 [Deltaproteobacteria bacterium]|nr:hypothetical protein [Deltaproteobacteria bacterium]
MSKRPEKKITAAAPIIRVRAVWPLGILWALLCEATPALAIQTHGAPEGLYAHQIAHLAFLVAMVYIWLRTRHRRGTGWGLIRLAFVFFAIWNINTFINHGISAALLPAQFQGEIGGLPRYFVAHSFSDLYFFFGRMDHFLCIPAGLCLGFGLRKMYRAGRRMPSEDVY